MLQSQWLKHYIALIPAFASAAALGSTGFGCSDDSDASRAKSSSKVEQPLAGPAAVLPTRRGVRGGRLLGRLSGFSRRLPDAKALDDFAVDRDLQLVRLPETSCPTHLDADVVLGILGKEVPHQQATPGAKRKLLHAVLLLHVI